MLAFAAIPVSCYVWIFSSIIYNRAFLYVPIGAAKAYRNAEHVWFEFRNIVETDFSELKAEEIAADNSGKPQITIENGVLTVGGIDSGESVTVYDMQGRAVRQGTSHVITGLARGVYILRAANQTLKFSI